MASKPLLIIDRNIPYLQGVLEPFARVEYADFFTNESVKNADGLLIRTRTHINESLLANSNVKFIASATIGFDHIDLNFCKKNGIAVFNAPGCNAGSVQQYIASVLMNLLKKDQKFGEITLGIVGIGHTGSKLKQFAEAIGMKVLLNDPPRQRKEGSDQFVGLEKLLAESDIISFHVPLTREGEDATFHLLSEQNSVLIKPGTAILNASRGDVCDESSLKKLISTRNCEVVLDVWHNEPRIDHELLEIVAIATPHIAGYSADGKANASRMIAGSTAEFFGFNSDSFSFSKIPEPEIITIIPVNRTFEGIISECVLSTYNVLKDSERLKTDRRSFEHLRNSYPLRREFGVYKVNADNLPEKAVNSLSSIGFQIIKMP